MNGSICPSKTIKEGQPQGSVISLLFFTININDLLAEFEKDTFVSDSTDDLWIVCRARNKEMIVASLQTEVNKESMQIAPEEERQAQRSIFLSEST